MSSNDDNYARWRRGFLSIVTVVLMAGCQAEAGELSDDVESEDLGGEAPRASGQILYAVTTGNRLIKFDSADPCMVMRSKRITGIEPGEDILGIDFRPATGELFALGSASRLYVIDPGSGAASLVGNGAFTPTLVGASFGFDFNPVVDRIRIVSDAAQNLRANPDTGAIAAVDGMLRFATCDPLAGPLPGVVAAAYTNPDRDPSTGTELYGISALSTFVEQDPPNDGVLNIVGQLGLNTGDLAGLDIGLDNVGYAVLSTTAETGTERRCGDSELVTVDVETGAATSLGYVGSVHPVRALAIPLF